MTAGSPSREPGAASPPPDDLLAVIAHSLLGSMSIIVGGTELLSAHWAELEDEHRTELILGMRSQARHVADVLDDLVRLGDPQLVAALEGLRNDDDGAPGSGDA